MTYVREGNVLRRVVTEPKVEPNVDMWSVFNDIPTDLTKEQLVLLGAELGVKLTMRQKEATMIEKIYESIELGV